MSIQECTQMMEQLIREEGQRLGIGSPDFIRRHNEIMEAADRQLLLDLAMEQREEA
ncbi:hypothetical protein HNQ56_004390 [Anaerotaenia torta]|uniref:hypothetical protein n=1 Tax=Anaerotaenia torta TaxID=433293 RepID=UPI003D233BCB